MQALDALKEGIIDGLGGLEEALAYIEEMKLTSKAAISMTGESVYGKLKREMWRETVEYLEQWSDEHNREFAIDARRRREKEAAVKKVKEWEIKAKL